MRKDFPNTNSRFAWLTPLSNHLNSNGPWLLVENNSGSMNTTQSAKCRKVTHSCLLQLISDVLNIPTDSDSTVARARWDSECGRFSAIWSRSDSNASRLFVQRPEDYFSRMELQVWGQVVVAFQEPVWPHLQERKPLADNHLQIPIDCLDTLEAGALTGVDHEPSSLSVKPASQHTRFQHAAGIDCMPDAQFQQQG